MDLDSMIGVLRANGPLPELTDHLMLFGQLVGAWDVDVVNHRPDGTKTEVQAEWHFGWALAGRAVVDVWIAPRRSRREAAGLGEWGMTVRFFDPAINAWRSTWHGPGRGLVLPFVARPVGDEIVLEGSFEEGNVTRWIFSEITPARFSWRAIESADGGTTWVTVQQMAARRVSP